MKRFWLQLLFAGNLALAQFSISPGDPRCSGTLYVDNGASNIQPLGAMEFGTNFRCSVPLLPGLYQVSVVSIEPRDAAIPPAPAVGSRVFQITANGQPTPPIDIYALVGSRTPYTGTIMAFVGGGYLTIGFTATAGNALFSSITVTSVQGSMFELPPPGSIVGGGAVWWFAPMLAPAPTTTPSAPLQ